MLTYEDCLGLCDLTEDEVAAIAEHEHIPRLVALELGNYLIHTKDGVPVLKRIILDDIAVSEKRKDWEHALKLRLVLRQFVRTHPDHPDRAEAANDR